MDTQIGPDVKYTQELTKLVGMDHARRRTPPIQLYDFIGNFERRKERWQTLARFRPEVQMTSSSEGVGLANFKIGDVIAWKDAPDGALVQQTADSCIGPLVAVALHVGGTGRWVLRALQSQWFIGAPFPWSSGFPDSRITIIALNCTNKTAAELQKLAEIYDVRKTLPRAELVGQGARKTYAVVVDGIQIAEHWDGEQARTLAAERLHAFARREINGTAAPTAAEFLRRTDGW